MNKEFAWMDSSNTQYFNNNMRRKIGMPLMGKMMALRLDKDQIGQKGMRL